MTGAQEAVDRILDRGGSDAEVLQSVVDVLHDRIDHYSGIGIYLVDGDDLVLGPWKGHEGPIVGEIDIDSDQAAAFGNRDREFLERISVQISRAAAGAAAVL